MELEGIQRQSHSFLQTLSPAEKEQLEQNIKDLVQQQKKIKEAALERKRQLNKGISDREVDSYDVSFLREYICKSVFNKCINARAYLWKLWIPSHW